VGIIILNFTLIKRAAIIHADFARTLAQLNGVGKSCPNQQGYSAASVGILSIGERAVISASPKISQ
jgi:hypothetical protein